MHASRFSRIVVGWDGSRGAVDGLTAAAHLAGLGGEVLALAIVPSFAHVEAAEERTQAIAESRKPLEQLFDQALTGLPMPSPRVHLQFTEGERIAEALLRCSVEQGYDLVVLGLHGNEGEVHHKLGHVAGHVVKAGCCPILLMPSDTHQPGAREPWSAIGHALRHPFGRRAHSRAD
jgi:nucleotide-binding universal stress UspA family protein